ncbi:MAG: hypothetical protein ACYCYI_13305 [Saccharofermentanales bacterium]
MLQNIPALIPKIFLPIFVLILGFLIIAAAMYLSRILGEYMIKRKNLKEGIISDDSAEKSEKSDEMSIIE